MSGWMIAAAVAGIGALGGCVRLLLRLDGAVAEELQLTEEDRRWTSCL